MNDINFKTILGKTCKKINLIGSDEEDGVVRIIFTTICGDEYHLYHEQDCCENVSVKDICGDLNDLIGSPIIEAEETINEQQNHQDKYEDSTSTWTFYKLSTIKGSVTINFLGQSNGYYCERVSFGKVGDEGSCITRLF